MGRRVPACGGALSHHVVRRPCPLGPDAGGPASTGDERASPAHPRALPGAPRDQARGLRHARRRARGPPPADGDGLAARLQRARTRRPGLPSHRRPPPLCARPEPALGEIVRAAQRTAAAPPVAGAGPAPRWTLKRLVVWVRERFGRTCRRETIRAALHRLGLSWKKAKKLLGRADPARRRAFVGHSGACWPTPSAPGTSWSTWTRRTSTRTPTSAT